MRAKYFKKLRKDGRYFDCYYRKDIFKNFSEIPVTIFALNNYQAAYKCMMRKGISQCSRFDEALHTSETFAKVIVYPSGSLNMKFRKDFY